MSKKIGVIVFPGSNCDHDTYHAMKHVMNADTKFLWHKEEEIDDIDLILVPGGFSYGDYLRSGAIARFSPVMKAVKEFAGQGRPVLGICNGFQILLEAGLLRSEEHTSELQSRGHLVCRLMLEKENQHKIK